MLLHGVHHGGDGGHYRFRRRREIRKRRRRQRARRSGVSWVNRTLGMAVNYRDILTPEKLPPYVYNIGPRGQLKLTVLADV
jgi:hypothetical protein